MIVVVATFCPAITFWTIVPFFVPLPLPPATPPPLLLLDWAVVVVAAAAGCRLVPISLSTAFSSRRIMDSFCRSCDGYRNPRLHEVHVVDISVTDNILRAHFNTCSTSHSFAERITFLLLLFYMHFFYHSNTSTIHTQWPLWL